MKLIPTALLLPVMYERISRIFPDKPWLKVVRKYEEAQRGFSLRTGQLEVENWFAFGLTRWDRQECMVDSGANWIGIVEAILLANRIAAWCEKLRGGLPGPHGLEKRFQGALKNPADMRALHFELYVAEILLKKQCQIHWPESASDDGTFDLLVTPSQGLPTFELECKSFAGDKGARATLYDGQRLLEVCMKSSDMFSYIPARPGEANILSINVSRAIPTDERKLVNLVGQIVDVLEDRSNGVFDGFEIVRSSITVPSGPANEDACFDAASSLPGATLAFISPKELAQGWRGLRIAWTGEFTLWDKAEDVAKDAIDRQLTKRRPGALALQFMNDSFASVIEANNPGNPFASLCEMLFEREKGLAMVVFSGPIEVKPVPVPIPFRHDLILSENCKFATFVSSRQEHRGWKGCKLFA
jgi:hypothetical protein